MFSLGTSKDENIRKGRKTKRPRLLGHRRYLSTFWLRGCLYCLSLVAGISTMSLQTEDLQPKGFLGITSPCMVAQRSCWQQISVHCMATKAGLSCGLSSFLQCMQIGPARQHEKKHAFVKTILGKLLFCSSWVCPLWKRGWTCYLTGYIWGCLLLCDYNTRFIWTSPRMRYHSSWAISLAGVKIRIAPFRTELANQPQNVCQQKGFEKLPPSTSSSSTSSTEMSWNAVTMLQKMAVLRKSARNVFHFLRFNCILKKYDGIPELRNTLMDSFLNSSNSFSWGLGCDAILTSY